MLTNWFRKESAKTYRVTREKVALVIVHFVESMLGIRAVQAFRREPRNQEIFDDVNEQYRVANLRAFRLVAWFMPGIKLIGNITISVVLLYGAYLAFQGEVTVGVLAAFLLYLRQFFEPMQEISQFYNTFQSASAALEKLSGVLEEEPERARAGAADPARRGARRRALRAGSAFEYVEGVAGAAGPRPRRSPRGRPWRWWARPAPARPRSPSCCPGSTTRPPGGSRSTGSTCATSTSRRCARAVVMVTQENYMFGGTVADNIRFGRPEATMEEVVGGGAGDRRARVHHPAAAGLRDRRRQQGRPALAPGSASSSRSPGRSSPTPTC